MNTPRRYIADYSSDAVSALIEAARDSAPVSGLTHNFYRYPARFSPQFARAVIETLSEPGDMVFDPFMGGGTTLVEALALGRNAVGVDISALAAFISEVKTTLYSDDELETLRHWTRRASSLINMHRKGSPNCRYADAGYHRHMNNRSTWRVRKAIEQCLLELSKLNSSRMELLARCVVLRTAQWALEGRKKIATIAGVRDAMAKFGLQMIDGARELRGAATHEGSRAVIHCLNRSTKGIEAEPLLTKTKPKLIVTSPPYPGIHVLYHRWQVDGRKETPAPFWIANRLDGSGASYYTMGDRKAQDLRTYFDNMRRSLRSVARVCTSETTLVQIMAFSDPSWQLPRYLSVADDVGFREFFLPTLRRLGDGRLWRTVPNRKWHANQKGKTSGSKEVVLFHRLSS